jgi:uncharacterized protein YndB with AHSA1/START domain
MVSDATDSRDGRFDRGLRIFNDLNAESLTRLVDSLADISPELGYQAVAWAFGAIYSRPALAPREVVRACELRRRDIPLRAARPASRTRRGWCRGAWVLTIARNFAHPAEKGWPWLTDPDRLRQWSPIVPDRALDSAGPCQARENPDDDPLAGDVIAVDPPHELVHRWGDDVVRRRLAPTGGGCRLTLEQTMRDRDHVAMNAAGWHICLDVLHAVMNGSARPRVVGQDAEQHGWESLRDEYAAVLTG